MSDKDKKVHIIAGEADVQNGLQLFRQRRFEEGFQAFMKAALKGHPGAMNNVSSCFYNGHGAPVDKVASFMWLKKAAEGGFTPAYYPLAVKYINADGVSRSVEEAVNWAVKANVEGNMYKEQAQGLLVKIEEILKKSPAGQMLQAAKNEVNQGMEYLKAEKFEEAFQCFLSAANKGDVNAMNNVAICYSAGQGVARDEEQAFAWTKKAAESGMPLAFFALADRYLNARGTARSIEQAAFWAKKAIEIPNPLTANARRMLEVIEKEAQYAPELREAFDIGSRLWKEQKYTEALTYLETAGRGGHAAALRMIGFAYQKGLGMEVNLAYAYQFLEAAAYRGDRNAVMLITHGFSGTNKIALWQAYGKEQGLEGCDRIFEAHIGQEQKVKRGYSRALNAQQAMEQAAQYWKTFEENPPVQGNPNAGALIAQPAFEKAMNYGNLDGVCGLAMIFEKIGNPSLEGIIHDMYKISAYMGHSYAMHQMGKYYDEIDEKVAADCYRQAAVWGCEEAQQVCAQRNVDWS